MRYGKPLLPKKMKKGNEELIDELLMNYLNTEEKETNFKNVSIKLDSSVLSVQSKEGCCKGKKDNNGFNNRSIFLKQSVFSNSESEDKDESYF